jgi:hypothetical protein
MSRGRFPLRTQEIIYALVLSLASPHLVAFAADSGYKVTYDGGSISSVKDGTDLRLYIDSGRILLMRNKIEIASIPTFVVTEISYGPDVLKRVDIGATLPHKAKNGYIGLTWDDGGKKGGAAIQANESDYEGLLAALEGVTGKKAVDSERPPPPMELAEMPQAPEAYRSEYSIPEFTKIVDHIIEETSTDVTLEATGRPGVVLTTGRVEMSLEGQPRTWCSGARHTIKGKLTIQGYTFVSDPNNPLVFRLWADRGYVYEKGRGMVITPSNGRAFLQSN